MRIVINANFWPDWHISLKGKASEKYILLGLLGHVDPSFSKLHETWSQPISCKDTLGPRVSLKGPRGVSNKRQFRLGGAFSGWENIWETGAKSWGEKFDLLCWKKHFFVLASALFWCKGTPFYFLLDPASSIKRIFSALPGFYEALPFGNPSGCIGKSLVLQPISVSSQLCT